MICQLFSGNAASSPWQTHWVRVFQRSDGVELGAGAAQPTGKSPERGGLKGCATELSMMPQQDLAVTQAEISTTPPAGHSTSHCRHQGRCSFFFRLVGIDQGAHHRRWSRPRWPIPGRIVLALSADGNLGVALHELGIGRQPGQALAGRWPFFSAWWGTRRPWRCSWGCTASARTISA